MSSTGKAHFNKVNGIDMKRIELWNEIECNVREKERQKPESKLEKNEKATVFDI